MSGSFRAMYFDGTYPTQPLPEEEAMRDQEQVQGSEDQVMQEVSTVRRVGRPRREERDVPPLTATEAQYAQALTALNISSVFIKRMLHTRRVSESGLGLTAVEKRKFEADIQAVIDKLKSGPSQGGTPQTVAAGLVAHLGENLNVNVIERGVKFDLAGGDKKTLGKWKKDQEAYEEWKLDADGRKYVIDEDGEEAPAAKATYGAYERQVKLIKPRLDMVNYMAETIQRLWSAAGIVT